MPSIQWNKSRETGIGSVDDEHQQMIELINEFYDLLREGGPKDSVIDLFGVVLSSVKAHFATEERLMREFGCIEYSEHKADHDRLLREVGEVMHAFEEGAYRGRHHDLAERVTAWFDEHFTKLDTKFNVPGRVVSTVATREAKPKPAAKSRAKAKPAAKSRATAKPKSKAKPKVAAPCQPVRATPDEAEVRDTAQ